MYDNWLEISGRTVIISEGLPPQARCDHQLKGCVVTISLTSLLLYQQIPVTDLVVRRDGQKIDPLSNELFIKTVYAPVKLKVKEKEANDEEGADDDDDDDNDEEGDDMDSKQDDELDDDLVLVQAIVGPYNGIISPL